jgi:hypothetical protein
MIWAKPIPLFFLFLVLFFFLTRFYFFMFSSFFLTYELILFHRREAEPGAAEVQPVRNTAGYLSIIF